MEKRGFKDKEITWNGLSSNVPRRFQQDDVVFHNPRHHMRYHIFTSWVGLP